MHTKSRKFLHANNRACTERVTACEGCSLCLLQERLYTYFRSSVYSIRLCIASEVTEFQALVLVVRKVASGLPVNSMNIAQGITHINILGFDAKYAVANAKIDFAIDW